MFTRRALKFVPLLVCAQFLAADEARDNRWKEDLAFLSAELPKRHANLFFAMPRERFERAVGELMDAIPSSSDAEVVTGIARIVAMAGDAHTTLSLSQAQAGFRSLPLTLTWFQDGLYVTAAAAEYRRALATRVAAIADKSVEEAHQLVSPVISHENEWWLRARSPRYLVMPELLDALKIAPGGAPVRFTFEDLAGSRFTLDIDVRPGAPQMVAPETGGFPTLYLRNVSQPYWFLYDETLRMLYFKYNQCTNAPGQPFSAFAAQLFSVFDTKPVERFVIDLRNNGGGDSSVINPFVQGLNARQARAGATRFYVLFNANTFSSAMLNARTFQINRDQAAAAGVPGLGGMKLLGEPTGGNPTVPWRNGGSFALPNSGLTVSHTTTSVQTNYRPGGAVEPDVPVPVHSSDWFTRHDPVLAAVLADSGAPAPRSDSAVAVLNGASFRPAAPVAPGSLASAFGDFSGTDTGDAAGVPLPTRMGATEVHINGVAAPLIAVRPSQINFQVPAATPAGSATVRVVRGETAIAAGTFEVTAAAPGLFAADVLDPSRPGAILNQDNVLNSAASPARAGEIIQLFATGQGATTPAVDNGAPGLADPPAHPVSEAKVYVGAAPAEVVFSGLSTEFPGFWQLNVRLPAGAVTRSGPVPVFVTSGKAASSAVTLWMTP